MSDKAKQMADDLRMKVSEINRLADGLRLEGCRVIFDTSVEVQYLGDRYAMILLQVNVEKVERV